MDYSTPQQQYYGSEVKYESSNNNSRRCSPCINCGKCS